MNRIQFFYFVIFSISTVFIFGFVAALVTADLPDDTFGVDQRDLYGANPNIVKSPRRTGTWAVDPMVMACKGSLVTEEEVKSAMAWWYDRGFYFGKLVYHEDPEDLCDHPWDGRADGYIVIRGATRHIRRGMKKGTVAETHGGAGWGDIESAVIYMVEAHLPGVLEHEFGHALGFEHYNKRGHMMHSKVDGSGWGDHGLRRMDRRLMEQGEFEAKRQSGQEK